MPERQGEREGGRERENGEDRGREKETASIFWFTPFMGTVIKTKLG